MTTLIRPEQMDENLRMLRAEIEQKTGKTPEDLYQEREKRITDAIELREPDRVPMFMQIPTQRFGSHPKEAIRRGALYFEPDMCSSMNFMSASNVWEILDVKDKVWPGHGLPKEAFGHQAIEGEFMKADEYDLFLKDPTGFNLRYYLPRVYGALQPLSRLPSLNMLYNSGIEGVTALFASPEFEQMAKALSKAGQEMKKLRGGPRNVPDDLVLLGFPPFSHFGNAPRGAPFDIISAHLRGMTGSMLDMYQRPQKLLEACEMIADMQIAAATPADPEKSGALKRAGMPLWRGDKVFMSQKQFETFYWPGLKKVMQAAIDLGYIPMPLFEAEFGDRLECLLDLPKGKVIASVEHMDVVRAKEILRGHCCVMGKGPHSLRYRSIKEVGEYYRDLVKVAGKGGGFLLWMMLPGNAELEDIKAMVDSVKEAGRF
jgi:hypothetical protein